jgi:hypothetical protein
MSQGFNWRCPFCNYNAAITSERLSIGTHIFDNGSKYGNRILKSVVVVCPNDECKEITLTSILMESVWFNGRWTEGKEILKWQLLPPASIKPFPSYIPTAILADYREACLIRDLSPKASATLARRCLQGMIRDFWGVSRLRLIDEINEIRPHLDAVTCEAIDAVRNIGNVGAHMERDINLIVDVETQEAALLLGLIETLLTEWYVNRHERQERMQKLVAVAAEKTALKNAKTVP